MISNQSVYFQLYLEGIIEARCENRKSAISAFTAFEYAASAKRLLLLLEAEHHAEVLIICKSGVR